MRDLTDSYCERCGSHYIFGPSPAKGPTLAGARLLAKGLKNFVMTDGTSLDEALAAARIDDTHSVSTQVAEDFQADARLREKVRLRRARTIPPVSSTSRKR